jgi:hypothetical protein
MLSLHREQFRYCGNVFTGRRLANDGSHTVLASFTAEVLEISLRMKITPLGQKKSDWME